MNLQEAQSLKVGDIVIFILVQYSDILFKRTGKIIKILHGENPLQCLLRFNIEVIENKRKVVITKHHSSIEKIKTPKKPCIKKINRFDILLIED